MWGNIPKQKPQRSIIELSSAKGAYATPRFWLVHPQYTSVYFHLFRALKILKLKQRKKEKSLFGWTAQTHNVHTVTCVEGLHHFKGLETTETGVNDKIYFS